MPARYGIKYWCLVDTESGYLCDLDINLGRKEANNMRETSTRMKVVMKLCETYFYTNRCIIAENFFTSIPLCQVLWSKK